IEPSGVGPSATMEPPPPMFRPPQVRVLMRPFDAFRVSPQPPPAGDSVKSRMVGFVDGFSALSTLVTKASTLVSRAAVSPPVRQGGLASSFAKHPFAGSAPPSNFAFALATHSPNFTGSGFVVFLPEQPSSALTLLATHFFLPAEHLFRTGVGYPGSR